MTAIKHTINTFSGSIIGHVRSNEVKLQANIAHFKLYSKEK